MDVAQKLYEQGAITYHRTDNPNIDPAGIADILSYAKKAKLSVADKPRRWKAREGAHGQDHAGDGESVSVSRCRIRGANGQA